MPTPLVCALDAGSLKLAGPHRCCLLTCLNLCVPLGEELSQSFASADVFLMPSDSETLGFVVLESMASGVPVIGANAGGIPNLIDEVSRGRG